MCLHQRPLKWKIQTNKQNIANINISIIQQNKKEWSLVASHWIEPIYWLFDLFPSRSHFALAFIFFSIFHVSKPPFSNTWNLFSNTNLLVVWPFPITVTLRQMQWTQPYWHWTAFNRESIDNNILKWTLKPKYKKIQSIDYDESCIDIYLLRLNWYDSG